jgi:type IV pilus assembly protein PilA
MIGKLNAKKNNKGFTLIELMIVIAIIGILAAIAIPNFISYRNKSFCSQAEADANSIAGALADYFAVPTRTGLPTGPGSLGIALSGNNTASIGGNPNDTIRITVTDVSTRCPDEYKLAADGWTSGSDEYGKVIQ